MIDRIYQEAQQVLNKEQRGYLTPLQYNLYINSAVEEIYNWTLEMYRRAVRRGNWLLDGKELADYKRYYEETLDYFTQRNTIYSLTDPTISGLELSIDLPDAYRYFRMLFRQSDNTPIEKIGYKEFEMMKRNIYSPPTSENVYCSVFGNKILISPAAYSTTQNDKLILAYLRNPVQAVWGYTEINGKPSYDSANSVDVDAPQSLYDELLLKVLRKAGLNIRDRDVLQSAVAAESIKAQQENIQ